MLLSKAITGNAIRGSSERAINIRIPMTTTVVTGTGTFVQTIFIIPCLDFNLRPHESGANTTEYPAVCVYAKGVARCASPLRRMQEYL